MSGYSVTGVDLSKHQLSHARKVAPSAKLIAGDIRTVRLRRKFDVVTCLFDRLNYLTTRRDFLRALKTASLHLKPGGLFVFDVNIYEGMEDTWKGVSFKKHRDAELVIESSFNPKKALGFCRVPD